MATDVDFWPVGKTASRSLSLGVDEISGHLLADWVPSFPASVGPSFIAWPSFLLESMSFNNRAILTLRVEAGRTERQWKGFLSWMLGVAGARHVLADEGYRWVAPLSAFYPGAIQAVDLSAWHTSFPPASLIATPLPGSRSRLRPDYVALKSTAAVGSGIAYEWAIAEAKGTRAALSSKNACPTGWSSQVRNVVLALNGAVLAVPRHLVIATRVNPNASRPLTRRIQVRAWNRSHPPEHPLLDAEGAIDIVSAHLFGLFRGLGLRENALAIALAVQGRSRAKGRTLIASTEDAVAAASDRADGELFERTRRSGRHAQAVNMEPLSLETELGLIEVDIAEPVFKLARYLANAESDAAAVAVLKDVDSRLDAWQSLRRERGGEDGTVALPFGVELRLPREFERR